MSDQIQFITDNLFNLLVGLPGNRPGGLIMTLLLAIGGLSFGMIVAIAIGWLAQSSSPFGQRLAKLYIRVFRGVPLLLLLVLVHNVLVRLDVSSLLGWQNSSLLSALVALVLYSSSYQADIIASGLRAVPETLVDESRVLGLSPLSTYLRVKLPFGLRVTEPAMVGQVITLFKDTSVVVVLGVADLTTTAQIVLGADVRNARFWVTTYLMVGVLYFVVAYGLSQLAGRRRHQIARMGLISTFE